MGRWCCLDSPHPAQPALPWGVDTTTHSLLTHICLDLLEADIPLETSIHITGKGLRATRVGWERGPGLAWGYRVTFLFLWAKGQRPLGGTLSQC